MNITPHAHTVDAVLQNLIQSSWNAHRGFLKMARLLELQNQKIAFALRVQSEAHRRHAKLLQQRLREMKEQTSTTTAINEPLITGWVNVIESIPDRSPRTIIDACMEAEMGMFKVYCQAMEHEFDPATEWILCKNRKQIENCIDGLQYDHVA